MKLPPTPSTLIVAATKLEIPFFRILKSDHFLPIFETQFLNTFVAITGIGITQTVFWLTQILNKNRFDRVINVGISGSFRSDFELGAVFHVVEDRFMDQTIETDHQLLFWDEIGLASSDHFHIEDLNITEIKELPKAKAITSDTIHANRQKIETIRGKIDPDIETMEGAAVAFVCSRLQISFSQIRSVSNYVGVRDKSQWQITRAIENLNQIVTKIVQQES